MYDSTKWKLVPVDPTDAMIQAGIDAPLANTGDDAVDQPQDYRNVYGAMVGAAPESVSVRGQPVEVSEFSRGSEVITLSPEAFDRFEASLAEPDRPNEALKALMSRPNRWTTPTEQPHPVAVDAAEAFAKGFNTLETTGGKYKIVMQFSGHDDAWSAYTELGKLIACLDKVKELNQ